MKPALLVTTVCAALVGGTALAHSVEKWSSDKVNGFMRYWTTNNVGSNFVVWCHPQRKVRGTLLQVDIDGRLPAPNSRIKLVIDKDIMELPVNEQGYIDTDCATCSDTFGYVWHRLRSSSGIAVKFQDDSYAGFSLKGARDILPADVCPTDWDKRKAS